ncbi:hypothetical protein NADFUDRAFT_70406 [Nadsonia fulvescens var. elongata DSM 6958]|uniref:Uncharacterized protein n=1 Tax=Nadsonia fulvescens var. elongata DSM 6958 TaxID=857566 RepID=A0A1E3PL04_9ASCO|nr:hypothetical protein NADFUDRAFT_70406 [Nadsonia fulvescens var. elongata DSM 6958]
MIQLIFLAVFLIHLVTAVPLQYVDDSLETNLLSQIASSKIKTTKPISLVPEVVSINKASDDVLQRLFELGQQSQPIGKVLESSNFLQPVADHVDLYQGNKFIRLELFNNVNQFDIATAQGVTITEAKLIKDNTNILESSNEGSNSQNIPLDIGNNNWQQYLILNNAGLSSDITVENPQEIQVVISYKVDMQQLSETKILLEEDGLLNFAEFLYEDKNTKKQSRIEFTNYDLLSLEHDVSNKPFSSNGAETDLIAELAPQFISVKLWRRAAEKMVLL